MGSGGDGAKPDSPASSPVARSDAERTLSGGALEATQLLNESGALDRTVPLSESGAIVRSAAVATQPSPRPDEPERLESFGPYSKVEVLAEQGSIGLVARGYNDAFGRWELLKFLRPELSFEAEIERQFRREGRVLAQLSHPNVVQVFATHETARGTCLAMEYLKGESLSAHVRAAGGRLGIERCQELLLEAARGLNAAHDVGLLHRDINPKTCSSPAPAAGRASGSS